jgi:RHS repeat-associated protein
VTAASFGFWNGNRIQDERGTYLFNAREQVTRWTRPSGVVTDYGLNGSGSIVTQATTGQPTITYEYAADGQRLTGAVSNGVRTNYCYAAAGFGEITGYGLDCQAPSTAYTYDPFGRMTSSKQGSLTTTYSFDGLDRRDTKTAGGRTFDLSYVGASEALSQEQEFGGQSELRSYDYTGNALERLGMARKTSPTGTAPYRAYMTDAAGSIEGLENDQGNLVGPAYSYDPYGAQLTTETTLAPDARANPFRFEGHYYDAESKVYDMRARAYLPEIGRFLGEDRYENPVADQGLEADAVTQDRYAFAGGNPVDNIEFDGHDPIGSHNPRGEQIMRDSRGRKLRGRSEAGRRAARQCGCNTSSQPPERMPSTSSSYTTQAVFFGPDRAAAPSDAGRNGLLTAPTARAGVKLRYLSYEDEAFRSSGMLPPAHLSNANAAVDVFTNVFPLGGEIKAGALGGRGLLRLVAREGDDVARAARAPRSSFEALSRSAADELNDEGLTVAGRALQKHGGRPGGSLPSPTGNPRAVSQQAQQIVESVLQHPSRTRTMFFNKRLGEDVVDIRIPGRVGVRFTREEGRFVGFLEPRR